MDTDTRLAIGHFGDESFQSITCTGTDKLPNQNNQETEYKKKQHSAVRVAIVDSTKHSRPDRASFCHLLRHPARKRNGSILMVLRMTIWQPFGRDKMSNDGRFGTAACRRFILRLPGDSPPVIRPLVNHIPWFEVASHSYL